MCIFENFFCILVKWSTSYTINWPSEVVKQKNLIIHKLCKQSQQILEKYLIELFQFDKIGIN